MNLLKNAKHFPVGVDVGVNRVRAVQLVPGLNGLATLAGHLELEHAGPREAVEAVSESCRLLATRWKAAGFTTREVSVAVPRSLMHLRSVRLPHMPPDELQAAARLEVAESVPFSLDESQVRCLTAGEVRQGPDGVLEVLVIVVRDEDLHRLTAAVHYSGLIPASIDIEPAALLRTATHVPQRGLGPRAVHALLDVGALSSRMVIGQGTDLGFVKTLDIGSDRLDEAVARRLNLSQAEAASARLAPGGSTTTALGSAATPDAMVRDASLDQVVRDALRPVAEELGRLVSMCLRYHSVTLRGPRPERLLVSGVSGCDPALQQCLSAATGLEVIGNPAMDRASSLMPTGAPGGLLGPAWTLAMGLALRRFGACLSTSGVSETGGMVAIGREAAASIPAGVGGVTRG
jgi:type IV pilus assembly protein PilM